jgi:O-antigen/teichoic acid export membrane protein
MRSFGAKFIRDASGNFILKSLSIFLALCTNILLARHLGPEEYGVYIYTLAIIGLIAVFLVLGFPDYLVRELPKYKLEKNWPKLKGLLKKSNQIVFILSTIIVICLFLIFITVFMDSKIFKAFMIALPLLLLNPINDLRQASLRGLSHVVTSQLPELALRPATFLIFLLCFAIFNVSYGADTAVGIYLFCTVLAFASGFFMLRKALPYNDGRVEPNYETEKWLKGSLPFFFLGSLGLINNQTDIIMIGILRSASEVGVYKVAVQGAQLVIFMLLAVNMTIAPKISELHEKAQTQKLERLIKQSARVVLAFALPLGFVFILWGQVLISIVFGAEYITGSYPLSVLCLSQMINAGMGSVGLILNMTGNEKDTLKGHIIAALVNIILNLVLIPYFGINGAAWATAVSMICWNLILGLLVFKRLGIWAHAIG